MEPESFASHGMPGVPPSSHRSLAWRIVQFPLTLLLIGVALQVFVVVAWGFSNMSGAFPDSGPAMLVQAGLVSVLVLSVHRAFNRYIDADPHNDMSGKGAVVETGAGIAFGFGLFTLITAVVWVLGGYEAGKVNGFHTIWPMLATFAILPGVTEEVIFRGLIFRFVERAAGSWIALIVSAVLFGAAHLTNPNAGLIPAIAIAVEAGIMLGAVYMLTRRLWAAIGVHAAWNFTQGWVFGIPVSGVKEPGLIDSKLSGPEWLTGGAFGLEASIVAMVLATVAGLVLLKMAHKKGRFIAPMWSRKTALT